jgi:hypothetical protein
MRHWQYVAKDLKRDDAMFLCVRCEIQEAVRDIRLKATIMSEFCGW